MIERIQGLPEHVLGFSAKGEVTGADYETVIIPAVEAMHAHTKKLRFLYHFGKEFSGFEAQALWDDAKVGMRYFACWERVAVVTDVGWLRAVVKAFGVVMPGDVRIFADSDLAAAVRWLSE